MLRFVHLSDFHLSDNKVDFENYCMKPLINDLVELNTEKNIDFILYTGDLVDKGGKGFGWDIEFAFYSFEDTVITPILNALSLPKDRFLFVPGNHDINKKLDSKLLESGLYNLLTTVEEVNAYIDENKLEGSQRIKQFKNFEREYFEGTQHSISNFVSTYKYSINNIKIGISCFNSAWRCWESQEDKGRILVGERQVLIGTNSINDCDLKIAMIHHPFDWLAPFEKKIIEQKISRSYNVMFCGHVHEGESSYRTSMAGNLFISVAPSNLGENVRTNDRTFSNGYSILDYTSDQIILSNRRYNHTKESFDPNTDAGDKEGKVIYGLPNKSALSFAQKKNDLCELIREERLIQIDEHLLSYRTNTKAPKKIHELFVLPHLTHPRTNEKLKEQKKENEKIYDLKDICTNNASIILVGDKESGKTILLDKLLVDFIDNETIYNKIPILINLDESPNSRFETDISRFLGISVREVSEILDHQEIVLLLDNITPTYRKTHKLKRLEEFITENSKVQIIATANSLIASDLPIELKDFPVLSKFTVVQINPFKSKQIRNLIQNWFSKNETYNNYENLDDMIKILSKLNIPSTPLAVSMFLSIIEFQPNYTPINNATMLENFIEILFEKHNPQEIYSEKFDYRNKQRLLAEIAYIMYENDLTNYRLERIQIIQFIDEYLRSRKFQFKAEELLKEFEEVGIFIDEFDSGVYYLSFRFNCFFKYFLMKNMDFNPPFKELVLSEESYLNFEDEIEYYTGLKRDEETILTDVMDRMILKFNSLTENVPQLKDLDQIFQSKSYLVNNLDQEMIQSLSEKEKPTNDEVDIINDRKLEVGATKEVGIQKKEEKRSFYKDLEICWTIVAKVLKNTEETTNGNLKSQAYQSLLKCTSIYIALAKILVSEYSEELQLENMEYLLNLLPFAQQVSVSNLVGSSKLEIVMEDDIKEKLYSKNLSFSELEVFLSIFIFADLKKTEHIKYIRDFMNKSKNKFIKDNILFKLINYYFTKKTHDQQYLNLLGELTIMEQTSNNFMKVNLKNKIMLDYKMRKEQKIRQGEVDGLGFDS